MQLTCPIGIYFIDPTVLLLPSSLLLLFFILNILLPLPSVSPCYPPSTCVLRFINPRHGVKQKEVCIFTVNQKYILLRIHKERGTRMRMERDREEPKLLNVANSGGHFGVAVRQGKQEKRNQLASAWLAMENRGLGKSNKWSKIILQMEFLRVAFCRIVNRAECRDSSQIVCESAGLRAERMTHDCGCRESQECREEFEKWTLRFQSN